MRRSGRARRRKYRENLIAVARRVSLIGVSRRRRWRQRLIREIAYRWKINYHAELFFSRFVPGGESWSVADITLIIDRRCTKKLKKGRALWYAL